jgi:hypothetical protein
MGRRTLFLDKLDDKTFKEAYSCIPQGTIGDVINERGVNYVYYNQHMFSSIELLDQVHDSIGFQIPLSLPWIRHAEMLMKIREELQKPLKTNLHTFNIPADLTMGLTFHKESGAEFKGAKATNNVEVFARELETEYNNLLRAF